jgi:hypothetical protein
MTPKLQPALCHETSTRARVHDEVLEFFQTFSPAQKFSAVDVAGSIANRRCANDWRYSVR